MSALTDNAARLQTTGLICDGSLSPALSPRGVNYWLDFAADNPDTVWTIVTPQDISFSARAVIPDNVHLKHLNKAKWVWTGSRSEQAVVETDPADVVKELTIHDFSLDVGTSFTGNGLVIHSCADINFTGRLKLTGNGTGAAMIWVADSTGGEGDGFNRNCSSITIDKWRVDGQWGYYLRSSGVTIGYDGSPQVSTLHEIKHLIGFGGASICALDFVNWSDTIVIGGLARSLVNAVNGRGARIGGVGAAGVYSIFMPWYAVDTFGTFAGRRAIDVNQDAKLVDITLYNNPVAEAGPYYIDPNANGVRVTLMSDSTQEIVIDHRDMRYAAVVPASSAPVVLADDTVLDFPVIQESPDFQNITFTLEFQSLNPFACGIVRCHCRYNTGAAGDIDIEILNDPTATPNLVVGKGSMTTGVFTDQYGNAITDGKFHVHVSTLGRIYMMNRLGSPVNGLVYSYTNYDASS